MSKNKKVVRSATKTLLIGCALLYVFFIAFTFMLSFINSETTIRSRITDVGTLTSGIISDYLSEKEQFVARIAETDGASAFLMTLSKSGADTAADASAADIFSMMKASAGNESDIIHIWAASTDSGGVISENSVFIPSEQAGLKSQKWFKTVLDRNNTYAVTALHESLFDSTQVFSIVKTVTENGNVVGWFGADINPDKLADMMRNYVLSDGSYPIIYTADHTVIYYPSDSEAFSALYSINEPPVSSFISHNSGLSEAANYFSDDNGKRVYYYLDSFHVPGWSIMVIFNVDALDGDALMMFGYEALALFLMVLMFFIIINSIFRDRLSLITPITQTLSEYVGGNFKSRINSERSGELGYSARAIDTLGKDLAATKAEKDNLANIDPITGLFNRVKLYECIDEHISHRSSSQNGGFAVYFLDLDNFKWLNETYGHKFGDDALSVFAKVLSDAITPEGQIFRYSGDEFLIVVDFNNKDDIEMFSGKLRSAFSNSFRVQKDSIYFRFSAGIALYPDNGLTADDLLRQASSALSSAKSHGKNCNAFVPEDDGNGPKKAYIAQVLSHALSNRELYLNYQPIISIETGKIYGFEALLRWESAEFGNIPPADFIKIAEESGEIVQIGMWILENACRFIQRVNRDYDRDIVISVNVSPVQLRQHDYIQHIRDVLAISHINPANIQLEITEGNLVDFIDNRNETIEEVISTGITLALDDFGTGYSSMAYLKNLPVKCLKIDSVFMETSESGSDQKSEAITASTIELVHSLGLIIVAEGIENREQYDRLKAMHCDYIQGYLFSKPLSEEKAFEFIPQFDQLHGNDK